MNPRLDKLPPDILAELKKLAEQYCDRLVARAMKGDQDAWSEINARLTEITSKQIEN